MPPTYLLDLRRELCDEILILVVAAPRAAPKDVAWELQNRHTGHFAGDTFEHIMVEKMPNRVKMMPILLVNRQLHDEALAAIALCPRKYCYELDVILANEKFLFPTWFSIPELTTRVDTIRTAVRISGTLDTPPLTMDPSTFCSTCET